jgi:peptidoglycan/LPS O-acetylase OafA/YrhL
MIYHLVGWHHEYPDAGTLLGRLGIYGVSMFFVLSGLSMALVYSRSIRDVRTSAAFFVRRIFRIWPLLWLAVVAVTVGDVLLRQDEVAWTLVLLNPTTLFGFVSPGSYINTGAWSIGNEMVYYALTPLLIGAYNRRLLYGNALLAATVAVGVYYGFHALSADVPLQAQWNTYINPFNNLFLFCAGVAIYFNSHAHTHSHGNVRATIAMLTALAIFCLYPVSGDVANIVVGVNRVVFCVAAVLLVLAFYNLSVELPTWLSGVLGALGVATYGIYLLHPIVHSALGALFAATHIEPPALLIGVLTVIFTIGASLVSYRLMEAPLIRLGRRITAPKAAVPSGNSIRVVRLPGA